MLARLLSSFFTHIVCLCHLLDVSTCLTPSIFLFFVPFVENYHYYYHNNFSISRSHFWSLNNSKSLQVSWTLLSILADLNNGVVCWVLILHLILNSPRLLSKPLGTFLMALSTIGTTVTLLFLRFFQLSSKIEVFFFLSFSFCSSLER